MDVYIVHSVPYDVLKLLVTPTNAQMFITVCIKEFML